MLLAVSGKICPVCLTVSGARGVFAWWIDCTGRASDCVIAPDIDEALCIAKEETGARSRRTASIRRPSFLLLNSVDAIRISDGMRSG